MESAWQDTEERYRAYLLTHGRGLNTARSYIPTARRFFCWCEKREIWAAEATSSAVAIYLSELRLRLHDGLGRPTNTVALTLSHLRAWFEFCRDDKLRSDDPTEGMSIKWRDLLPRRPLTGDELSTILAACHTPRDRVMIQLTYDCGLRVAEVVSIREEDIDFVGGVIRIHGKGSRDRPVSPSPETLDELTAFLGRPSGVLWWTHDSRPLTVKRAQNNMDNIARRAGVRAHWHLLRTTFANHALEQGVRLEVLQEMMGHSQITTTRHYAGWSIKRQAIEQMRGLHLVEHYLT